MTTAARDIILSPSVPISDGMFCHTLYGRIAEEHLSLLGQRFPTVRVDKFVIMPNHIHAIIVLDGSIGQTAEHHTLSEVVCAFKSLCTRQRRQAGFDGKMFQSSFHDHIIRCEEDYRDIWNYIGNNAVKWETDKLMQNSEL